MIEIQSASQDGTLEVFMELRDVNYPGSTYTLTYNWARELLVGVYFQAAMQQRYEVAFRSLQAER